ncbi:MAG: Na+/H+ antiporter [Candidatus Eremiobacteraeota bacterium]|nr:Na+/H+ antiporter [Candidatus Eremiobacteraeota bacterium]
MNSALLLVVLLCATVAAAILAKRINVPYPIAFVIGGILLAFVPHLPVPRIDPNLIFLLVLPPLLHAGGWSTDLQELKRNIRPVALLAIGLVLFSTVVTAFIAHALIGLDWAMAYVLGAIVSPPDAVAAEATFERMAVPRRIVAVLTGEGLLNDATALLLYRYAVIAAVAGSFSLVTALLSFPLVTIGGVLIGLLAGFVIESVLRLLMRGNLEDPTIGNVIVLIAPYASYLPADALGASGVLAVVTTGIYLNQRANRFMSSEGRVVGLAVWNMMIFLLNALVFLLIGLELPLIVSSLGSSFTRFVIDAVIISVAVILIRIVWVFPSAWLPRLLIKRVRDRDPLPSWRVIGVIAWSGMRGIVSLAAALALPYTDAAHHPLSGRAEIIFITLCVIVVTLVFQGLSLGPIISWLGVGETAHPQRHETQLRIRALEAGVQRLRDLEDTFHTAAEWEVAGRVLSEYETRIEHLRGHLKEEDAEHDERFANEADHRLQQEALEAERHEIARLRMSGEIPDDIFRSIAYDLDLAELRLR